MAKATTSKATTKTRKTPRKEKPELSRAEIEELCEEYCMHADDRRYDMTMTDQHGKNGDDMRKWVTNYANKGIQERKEEIEKLVGEDVLAAYKEKKAMLGRIAALEKEVEELKNRGFWKRLFS